MKSQQIKKLKNALKMLSTKKIKNKKNKKGVPNFRNNTKILGVGETKRWIDQEYDINYTDLSTIQLNTFFNTDEFKSIVVNYRFVKLVKIIISIYPRDAGNTVYFLMRWTDDIGGQHIIEDDNTIIKTVNSYRIQKIKFGTPNLMLGIGNNGALSSINPKEWVVADDLLYSGAYRYPGQILVKTKTSDIVRFRVSVKLHFKGAKIPDVAKLKELIKIEENKKEEIKKLKSKEELKKEEEIKKDEKILDEIKEKKDDEIKEDEKIIDEKKEDEIKKEEENEEKDPIKREIEEMIKQGDIIRFIKVKK